MLSEEKKKRIEALTTDEMLHELNLANRSRFQRESFAYLKTCCDLRLRESPAAETPIIKPESKRSWHKTPLGILALGVLIVVVGAMFVWVLNHHLGLGL